MNVQYLDISILHTLKVRGKPNCSMRMRRALELEHVHMRSDRPIARAELQQARRDRAAFHLHQQFGWDCASPRLAPVRDLVFGVHLRWWRVPSATCMRRFPEPIHQPPATT